MSTSLKRLLGESNSIVLSVYFSSLTNHAGFKYIVLFRRWAQQRRATASIVTKECTASRGT